MSAIKNDVRLLAFYLPQFHPVPENDEWWGKGFTEWTNVAKGQPLFPGHYQPHLPADLGFYDLRVPEVRQAQADLAREYGIYGFCYYHYWFNGKRLLERPLDEMLATGEPAFPFCLCWANENWTKVWDGADQHILIAQEYSPEDDRRHIQWLVRVFRHQNYIRIDGKPLFLIYRISKLPDPMQTTSIWREEARKAGIGEIYLATVESLREDRGDPTHNGCDAAVEFQPDWINLETLWTEVVGGNGILDYAVLPERMLRKETPSYKRFPCVTPGWDNTIRRKTNAAVLKNSTPKLYQGWLEQTIDKFEPASEEENWVFVNAWNEWGEGNHLEPCQKWGRGYLEATRRALRTTRAPFPQFASRRGPSKPEISVCLPTHNGSKYLGEAIASILEQTRSDFEVIVVDDGSTDGTDAVIESFQDARIQLFRNPNRLGVVGTWNRCIELSRGQYVCIFPHHDLMMPENLAHKTSILDKHRNVGFVYSSARQMDAASVIREGSTASPNRERIRTGSETFKLLLLGGEMICSPTVMVRRECYETLGGFDSRLPLTAGSEMWMRIALFNDIAYLAEPLVTHRPRNENGATHATGVEALKQHYLAKRIVLDDYTARIQGIDTFRSRLVQEYTQQALQQARHHYRQQQYEEAKGYLAFAVDVRGTAIEESSPEEYVDWFAGAVDQLWQQEPQSPLTEKSLQVGIGTPEQALASPTIRRQIARGLSGEAVGQEIPTGKLIKALCFKLAARPEFAWLYRFRRLGKRLLG